MPLDDAASTALVLLYPGVSAFEAVGALAALRAAGRPAEFVGAEALVPAQEGLRLVPHRLRVDDLARAEAAVLPGGDPTQAARDAGVARALRERRGRWTLAAGEAVRLVARAGLAHDRLVALAPGAEPIEGAHARPARLVADGRLLTCAAGDALVDLVLHYVAQADGHDAAVRAAHALGREHRPFVLGAPAGE